MASSAKYDLPLRPRRLRRTENLRRMARETRLSTDHLIAPLFVMDGTNDREEVSSMPDTYRHTIDRLVDKAETLDALGVPAVALFPAIPDALKTSDAEHALDPDHLYPNAVRALNEAVPDLMVITDTALDPYNADGHDGLVRDGVVQNDATIDVMRQMAVLHAEAGADIVAPSDMMDGRVGLIREALDAAGHTDVAILSYTAKYSSNFYGPFRDALDSAPKDEEAGAEKDVPENKDTYQMDPANGEEAVIKAAAQNGWLDEKACAMEALTGIRRAGADLILTYFAADAARWLNE